MLVMLLSLIVKLADLYSMIIVVYVLLSWFPMNNGGVIADIYRVLGRLCDPYLNLFKKVIPPIGGMVDISPVIALLVLQFGVRLIVGFF